MKFPNEVLKLPIYHNFSEVLIFVFTILVLAFVWNIWKNWSCYSVERAHRVPTNNSIVIECVLNFFTYKLWKVPFTSTIFQTLNGACRGFEKEGLFQFYWCRRRLVIFGEESLKIFASDEASADKSSHYEVLKEGLGEGLVTSNGKEWKKDRKILNPLFNTQVLKEKMPIFNKNADILLKNLEQLAENSAVDLLPSLESFSLPNLLEFFLDVNVKDAGIDIERFYELLAKVTGFINSRWLFPSVIATSLKWCTPTGWKYMRECKEYREYIRMLTPSVKECKFNKSEEDSRACLDSNGKSLFHTLLNRQIDPSLTSSYIDGHVCTFITAGTDTVIYTIQWCLFLLGHNKDVQQRAFEEVQSLTEKTMTYEDLCRLEYLDCIIKETLRLYPTVPIIARHLKKDMICGKYKIQKGTTLVFFIYRLHRNPEIYPDPEKFNPDRFRQENAGETKWAYFPFSEGYRNCIGKTFAMVEMKIAIAAILRNYEVTSLDRIEDVGLNWSVILMPDRRLRMQLTPRNMPLDAHYKTN